ncbi:MAG TPA: hypothetical protein VFP12_09600 [Allosphingosinicella sp.]|nr:hypothetical protein [Allosphingosinicella sp.]
MAEDLCRGVDHPDEVEIHAVRAFAVDENESRLRRLLSVTGEACECTYDRSDWTRKEGRTLVRLPNGGRAELFHASGALRVVTGLEPMAALFASVDKAENLTRLVDKAALRLHLQEWVSPPGRLEFERLWQIKAAAADRKRVVGPILCRAVGAYRQSIGRLPVLGGASVAVKIAAEGRLDSISMQLVETHSEPVETARLIGAEAATHAVARLLDSLLGADQRSRSDLNVKVQPLQLGYLHPGKRKPLRTLAPHYFASVEIEKEEEEAQAYHLIVPATERIYQPLCFAGREAPIAAQRRAA